MADRWNYWVQVYNDPKWYTNTLEFDTPKQAIEYASRKFDNWTQCENVCVCRIPRDPNDPDTKPDWIDHE